MPSDQRKKKFSKTQKQEYEIENICHQGFITAECGRQMKEQKQAHTQQTGV